eukprot:Filipodium_phascolosomae@DN5168_c0_g1_i1.p1
MWHWPHMEKPGAESETPQIIRSRFKMPVPPKEKVHLNKPTPTALENMCLHWSLVDQDKLKVEVGKNGEVHPALEPIERTGGKSGSGKNGKSGKKQNDADRKVFAVTTVACAVRPLSWLIPNQQVVVQPQGFEVSPQGEMTATSFLQMKSMPKRDVSTETEKEEEDSADLRSSSEEHSEENSEEEGSSGEEEGEDSRSSSEERSEEYSDESRSGGEEQAEDSGSTGEEQDVESGSTG